MVIRKAITKGQVVIPAGLRKRLNIKKCTRHAIFDGEAKVIPEKAVPDDPIEASRGMLKGKTSLMKALLTDRREDERHEGERDSHQCPQSALNKIFSRREWQKFTEKRDGQKQCLEKAGHPNPLPDFPPHVVTQNEVNGSGVPVFHNRMPAQLAAELKS